MQGCAEQDPAQHQMHPVCEMSRLADEQIVAQIF